jgi:hypothetical protein
VNFIPILTIALLINLPIILISENLFPVLKEQTGLGILSIYLQLFALICQVPAWVAAINITEQYVLNGKANAFSALKKAFSKWSELFKRNTRRRTNWEALIALAFFLASDYFRNLFPLNLLLLIPGYVFLVRIFFSMMARYLRDMDIDSAYLYSNSIVQGRWKKIFLVIISLAINNLLLSLLFGFSIGIVIQLVPNVKSIAYAAIYLIGALINNLWFIVGTLLFLNLEYRKE